MLKSQVQEVNLNEFAAVFVSVVTGNFSTRRQCGVVGKKQVLEANRPKFEY